MEEKFLVPTKCSEIIDLRKVIPMKYSEIFIHKVYLKVRNFRGKKISRISRICLEFAKLNSREKSDFKLNSRENFSFLHLLRLGSTNIERKPFCLPVCQLIHGNF